MKSGQERQLHKLAYFETHVRYLVFIWQFGKWWIYHNGNQLVHLGERDKQSEKALIISFVARVGMMSVDEKLSGSFEVDQDLFLVSE